MPNHRSTAPSNRPVRPKDAASVVLLRGSRLDPEVLLGRRRLLTLAALPRSAPPSPSPLGLPWGSQCSNLRRRLGTDSKPKPLSRPRGPRPVLWCRPWSNAGPPALHRPRTLHRRATPPTATTTAPLWTGSLPNHSALAGVRLRISA